MSNNELLICDPCWDRRWDALTSHACQPEGHGVCDCPCVERHNDLDTIDLEHEQGLRDITSPFSRLL